MVFPLRDRHHRVVGFYGRSLTPSAKIPHRFCAGTRTGLFHRQAAHGVSRVYLTEGILDALAVHQAGVKNVMALGRVQGLSEALLEHLQAQKVRDVLCLDGDQAGRNAAPDLRKQLEQRGLAVAILAIPDGQDPLSCKPDELRRLLHGQPSEKNQGAKSYQKLSSSGGKLKVQVTLTNEAEETAEATVDLYSARSRKQEAISIARRLSLDVADIEAWFFSVLKELEAQKTSADEPQGLFANVEIPPMSENQRKETLDFLSQKNLVDAILSDMEALGYVGET